MVENNLGIIVACLPPLAPLIRSFRDKSSNASRAALSDRRTGYNLQNMKSGRSGLVELGRGNDGSVRDEYSNTVLGGNSSEEFILETGIQKKTEIVVSHEMNERGR
jgi:hypothetical protein